MSKQTAVEWFVKQLLGNGLLRVTKDEQLYKELRDQVRAMEREQIIDAYLQGSFNWERQGATQFYNETYKGGEQ